MTTQVMRILGYSENYDGGVCHGIAVSAAISYCSISNGKFLSVMNLMQNLMRNIDPKILCNVLQLITDLKDNVAFENKCIFDEICKYLEKQKNEDSKSSVKSAMKNNEDSEPDVKSAIEKIDRKIIDDFIKFKNFLTKKQLLRIKTVLDNICMFMGSQTLPKDFFKKTDSHAHKLRVWIMFLCLWDTISIKLTSLEKFYLMNEI